MKIKGKLGTRDHKLSEFSHISKGCIEYRCTDDKNANLENAKIIKLVNKCMMGSFMKIQHCRK